MKCFRSLRLQRGAASLIELTLAVTAAAVIQAAAIPILVEKAEQLTTDVTVSQIFTLQDAVNLYRDQVGQFPTQAANCAVAADVINELVTQGYLTNFAVGTAWATDIATSCTVGGGTPDTFTVTVEAPSQWMAQVASSRLVQSQVIGTGPFSVQTSLLGVGIPGFNELLHRNPVPGRPELNRMNTDIDMNGNDLNGIDTITSTTITSGELFWGPAGQQSQLTDDNGAIELNNYLDFHFGGVAARDFDGRIQATAAGRLWIRATNMDFGSDPATNTAVFALRPTFNGAAVFNAVATFNDVVEFGSNRSQLALDQGGAIELGGNNGNAGVGSPYIDFHFNGLTQDYNVRLQNRATGVLTAEATTLEATNDVIVRRNLEVAGRAASTDFVLTSNNRSLGQAVNAVFSVGPGDIVPKPDCAALGLTAQIFTSVSSAAEGATSTPIYQVKSYADDNGTNWTVRMELLTENGLNTSPDSTYNRIVAVTKCE